MFNRDDNRFGSVMMIGSGLAIGGLLIAIAGVFFVFFTGVPVGLWMFSIVAPIMIVVGLIMVATVVLKGLQMEKKGDAKAGLRIENGTWIQAKYATLPGVDDLYFSEELFNVETPGVKFFLRVKYPDGRVEEPKTSLSIWRECVDGQVGIAELQGDWLTRYTPNPPPKPASPSPPDARLE